MWVHLVRTCGITGSLLCASGSSEELSPKRGYLWSVIFLNPISLLCFHVGVAVTSYFPGRRYNYSTNSYPLLHSRFFYCV